MANASNIRAITKTEIVAKEAVVAVATTTMTAEITKEMIVVMAITMVAPSPITRAAAASAVTEATEATEMAAKVVDTATTEAITTIDGTISVSRVAPTRSLTRRQLTPIPTIVSTIRMIPASSARQ